jgi:hypothetical protein
MSRAKQQEFSGMEEEWKSHWNGMPEYVSVNREAISSVVVNFETTDDIKVFSELIGIPVTTQTRGIFFPHVAAHDLEYVDES